MILSPIVVIEFVERIKYNVNVKLQKARKLCWQFLRKN